MPNHVTTTMTITGPSEDLDTFKRAHIRARFGASGEASPFFDFNTIVAMPSVLENTRSPAHVDLILAMVSPLMYVTNPHAFKMYGGARSKPVTGKELLSFVAATRPQEIDEARRTCLALAMTGFPSWYEWSVEYWGTKWNSYEGEEVRDQAGEYVFRFETAWAFPWPIFRALAKRYPSLVFDCATYDEGGNFGGVGQFNGTMPFETSGDLATPAVYVLAYGREPEAEES